MRNEVEGRIVQVLPIERGTGQRGPWATAKIVIEYENGRYNSNLMLECRSSRAEEFAKLRAGQKGKFSFDVSSREYNGRWYHNVNCFDWTIEGAHQAPPQAQTPAAMTAPEAAKKDDLPF